MRRSDCVFCKIARGEVAAHRVYEDELTVAFMDVGQGNPGHLIVAIRSHLETVADLSAEQATAAFQTVTKVARAIEAAFAPEGLTIVQPNGIAGGQSIPHFHLHLLPRYPNDGVKVTWPIRNLPADELATLAARIVAARRRGAGDEAPTQARRAAVRAGHRIAPANRRIRDGPDDHADGDVGRRRRRLARLRNVSW